jgi:formate hydrogenlyase transcriptional activator
MTATTTDLEIPPEMELGRGFVGTTDFLTKKSKIFDYGQGYLGEAQNALMAEHVLPRGPFDLAASQLELPEVQAICAWIYHPEHSSMRLQPLIADLSGRLGAAMELFAQGSIADWVCENQRPLLIRIGEPSCFPEVARLLQDRGIRSFCAVPMLLQDRQICILGLAGSRASAFTAFCSRPVRRGSEEAATPVTEISNSRGARLVKDQRGRELLKVERKVAVGNSFEGIVGRSAGMPALHKQIKTVAPTVSTVLILGETGTGKELIARAIHNLSLRRERPFIKVNCAAIPAGLIESELFGHERGAFTGAIGRRVGRFEMANGGTVFLDEIGDIPLELQPKLLRVLQEQEFERLGSTQTMKVDVRVVAATSRDLPRMVSEREFRGDLYYRINVFPLRVPALRERIDDIPLMVNHFLDLYAKRMDKPVNDVPAEAMAAMLDYSWPGNVRELQNFIERAVILSPGSSLRPPLEELRQVNQAAEASNLTAQPTPQTLEQAEREHIIQALAATNWVIGGPKGAGARLGLARTTLIAKMHRLGISRAQA